MVTRPDVIVFDMDGVLVDVRASYRDCIIASVKHFTGRTVSHDDIQQYKNRGGFNNDWLLTQVMCEDRGVEVDYAVVVEKFNAMFFGTYMQREKWLPAEGLLERLAARAALYVFTGRLHEEAQITLRRFEATRYFTGVIGDDNVTRSKPAPDGLIDIQDRHPGAQLLYLGDTVDDAGSSAAAGVPFVGIGPHSGAAIAIPDINQLEALLP
jgi:HAD superfamily hydrolase (TIGR01548 family)